MKMFKDLLPQIVTIARDAGARILEVYATDFDVEHKGDESPLTAADLAAHRCIVDGLAKLDVSYPVLSEESREQPFAERADWNPYWLVDPLDGTKEFVNRNGEFTVNIALIQDHAPVLGVVHVPVTGVTYFAANDHGAFKQDGEAAPTPISVHDQPRTPRVVGSRSHRGELVDKYLANLGEHEMVPMGSSLKFCVVAEGGADVYPRLGLTSEWDTAAAHAVVNAAGGRVVQLDGRDLDYNAKEDILNPHFVVLGNPTRAWLDYLP
ncbi:MAG: 3'(2'),5'-bisphosphate nucleotidase CysQ [Gammaproteobacteria bacterium]